MISIGYTVPVYTNKNTSTSDSMEKISMIQSTKTVVQILTNTKQGWTKMTRLNPNQASNMRGQTTFFFWWIPQVAHCLLCGGLGPHTKLPIGSKVQSPEPLRSCHQLRAVGMKMSSHFLSAKFWSHFDITNIGDMLIRLLISVWSHMNMLGWNIADIVGTASNRLVAGTHPQTWLNVANECETNHQKNIWWPTLA